MTTDGTNVVDSSYDKYFLRSEGTFFYSYLMIWIVLLCITMCIVSIIPCVGFAGALTSLSNIEDFFWNMDSVQNEFKKHQEKAQNPGAQQPGAAGASSSGPQPGAQNMEDFREEFKQS